MHKDAFLAMWADAQYMVITHRLFRFVSGLTYSFMTGSFLLSKPQASNILRSITLPSKASWNGRINDLINGCRCPNWSLHDLPPAPELL